MEKRNKIYVANNKLMKRTRISSARETLKFNKLLYFARTFYGKIKCWGNEKRIIHISNRIKKVFPPDPGPERMAMEENRCCAEHNNLSSEISFFDWLVYFSSVFLQHGPGRKAGNEDVELLSLFGIRNGIKLNFLVTSK